MNIKHRLKKLENVIDDSTVCGCFPQRNFESYRADLSEDSESSEPVLMTEAVPDVCLNCRKPIEKRIIIFQFYDQTTKDRFPEEWNKS